MSINTTINIDQLSCFPFFEKLESSGLAFQSATLLPEEKNNEVKSVNYVSDVFSNIMPFFTAKDLCFFARTSKIIHLKVEQTEKEDYSFLEILDSAIKKVPLEKRNSINKLIAFGNNNLTAKQILININKISRGLKEEAWQMPGGYEFIRSLIIKDSEWIQLHQFEAVNEFIHQHQALLDQNFLTFASELDNFTDLNMQTASEIRTQLCENENILRILRI